MAENTPESDLGSIECFQNYAAPEVFIQGLAGIVDQQDVESMIRAQKQMLQRFEKTNEMLSNCNTLSMNRLKVASSGMKKDGQLLAEMRKDLDGIFKRIRLMKGKLSAQNPQAFSGKTKSSIEEEEDAAPNKSNVNRPKTSASCEAIGTHSDTDVSELNDNPVLQPQLLAAEEEISSGSPGQKTLKRANSSSSESNNGNSNNDSSPYTSDTG